MACRYALAASERPPHPSLPARRPGPGRGEALDVEGLPIAVVRIGDDVYAVGDRCTQQNASLSEGEVYAEERLLECSKHGSQFSLVTGEPLQMPALKSTPVYPVQVGDGVVYLILP